MATTQERLDQIKAELKECRDRIREAHDTEDAAETRMRELMDEQSGLIAEMRSTKAR